MASLLYIKASPMGELSFSGRAADAFLEGYRESNPGDEVKTIDLWKEDLPAFDFAAASGKYKVMHGKPHTDGEAQAWKRVIDVCTHFTRAEKFLVSCPMWNFGIPYRLTQYLDIIIQPGITFLYDPAKGYTGLITGRPLQLILARGGEYPGGSELAAMDYQRPYLDLVFRFIGFEDIRTIVIEPTMMAGPEVAARKLEAAVAAAREAGKRL